ncbi:hypothetical protein RB195_008894 [Necator americanus]|uniref:Peptidase S1 domain-containing protein n=1 Tax=Necator americanus TaxID=51031 RepID=A0ABR1CQU6_NECAM
MRFLFCVLFSAFLITTLKSAIAKDVYDPTTCGLPGPDFDSHENDLKSRKRRARDKRDIDNYYSADYNPTAGDETEEDENDPMRTKIMGGERAVRDELPWAAAVVVTPKKKTAHCFMEDRNRTISVDNMIPEGDVRTRAWVVIGGTCQKVDKKYNCAEEDVVSGYQIKRASYRSFFEPGRFYTRDFAILELTDDVPKHIHHACLPHMNKKIDIGDSSIRMSSFGWGSDPVKKLDMVPFLQKVMLGVKMTEKECKKFYPKKLDDTFCTFERSDRNVCRGDSGSGITANIGGRTYLAGVVSFGSSCDDLQSGREKPGAQLNTDVTKYAALIDSWLGTKKSK